MYRKYGKRGGQEGQKPFKREQKPEEEEQAEEESLANSREFGIFELLGKEVNFARVGYLANAKTVNLRDEDNVLRTMLLLIFVD